MQADTAPKDSSQEKVAFGDDKNKQVEEPVQLMRTLSWIFLAPAFASLTYGLLDIFAGFEPSTAIFFSVLFVLALLFSPERQLLDWYSLCFTTAAVGLFATGHPMAYVFGGIAGFFALMTLSDEKTGLKGGGTLILFGLCALNAGLASVVYLLPVWTTLALTSLYLFFYLSAKLLPIGLLARTSLMEEKE